MGKKSKPKLHHYVPQLYLRNFADEGKQVAVVDRKEDKKFKSNIDKVAAETHFYASQDEAGNWGVEFEEALAEFEGRIAPAIKSIVHEGVFPPSDEHREMLALFIASQWMRTPRVRDNMAQMGDWLMKTQVALGGKSALREAMLHSGMDVSDDEVDREWAEWIDFDSYEWQPHKNEHMQYLADKVDGAASMLMNASFCLVRFARQRLLTTDTVIGLHRVYRPGNAFLGVGLLTADEIHVPLARDIDLILLPRGDVDGYVFPASTAMARHINYVVGGYSRRWVFHHPEDSPLNGIELPSWSEQKINVSQSPKDFLVNYDANAAEGEAEE